MCSRLAGGTHSISHILMLLSTDVCVHALKYTIFSNRLMVLQATEPGEFDFVVPYGHQIENIKTKRDFYPWSSNAVAKQ